MGAQRLSMSETVGATCWLHDNEDSRLVLIYACNDGNGER